MPARALPLFLVVPLRLAGLGAGLVAGLVMSACGRTADPKVACPQPSADCAELVLQQAGVEGVYATATDDEDTAVMDEAGQCVQLFVEASLDQECVEGCAELCRLHPCGVVDNDGNRQAPSACPDRCEELFDEGAFSDAELEVAAVKAGENPGLCSCRACTAVDDALCTRLFDCVISPAE